MKFFVLISIMVAAMNVQAKIVGNNVEYKDGETVLEGYVAFDDKIKTNRPLVFIVHDWMGLRESTKEKAQEVAKMGYVAFALDIFGKNSRPKNTDEAAKIATQFKEHRASLRQRAQAGFDFAKTLKNADLSKATAIGYCFGGTTVLEMGRAGMPLVGIASFHGGLSSPTPADAKNIKAKVLVMHGAIDPYVPMAEVEAFEKEMNDAKTEYTLIKYSGAVHSFTIKEAGSDITKGAAYNERADKLSWKEFSQFVADVAPIK